MLKMIVILMTIKNNDTYLLYCMEYADKVTFNLKQILFIISFCSCQVAMDCRICYLKSSYLSESILTLLKGKQQDSKGEE